MATHNIEIKQKNNSGFDVLLPKTRFEDNGLSNEYFWDDYEMIGGIVQQSDNIEKIQLFNSSDTYNIFVYGEEYEIVDSQSLSLRIKNYQYVQKERARSISSLSDLNVLKGKYFYIWSYSNYLNSPCPVLYICPQNITLQIVTDSASNYYLAGQNGISFTKIMYKKEPYSYIHHYLNSNNLNQYPLAKSFYGQLGDFVHIETGCYIGTGVAGEDVQIQINSLPVKLLGICANDGEQTQEECTALYLINDSGTTRNRLNTSGSSSSTVIIQQNNNQFNFNINGNLNFNKAGVTYKWFAVI